MCNQNDNDVECIRKREFINTESVGGTASYEIAVYPILEQRMTSFMDDQSEYARLYYDSMFTLRDCHRSVTIDFSCSELKDIDNARHKLNVLISALEQLRDINEEQFKKFEEAYKLKESERNKED